MLICERPDNGTFKKDGGSVMQANLLRAEIAYQGLSHREIAKRAKISKSAFSAKINGQRPFDTDEAVRICQVLGITVVKKKADIFLT